MAGIVLRQTFSKGCCKNKRVKEKSGRKDGDENGGGKEVKNSEERDRGCKCQTPFEYLVSFIYHSYEMFHCSIVSTNFEKKM